MTIFKILRSLVAGRRPTGREAGEVYVNYPERQFGVVDTNQAAMDLVGVRFHSADTTYVIGDHVVRNGSIYRCKVAVTAPEAFDPAKWDRINAEDFAKKVHTHVEADITDLGDYIENVVDDITPQLGGNLDGQDKQIINVSYVGINSADPWAEVHAEGYAPSFILYDLNSDTDEKGWKIQASGGKLSLMKMRDDYASSVAAYQISATGNGNQADEHTWFSGSGSAMRLNAAGQLGIGTMTPQVTLDVGGTDAIRVPAGSISERSAGRAGEFRFNTELSQFEGYDGTNWGSIGGGGGAGQTIINEFRSDLLRYLGGAEPIAAAAVVQRIECFHACGGGYGFANAKAHFGISADWFCRA